MKTTELMKVPYAFYEQPPKDGVDFWCPLCGQPFEEPRSNCRDCGIIILGETVQAQKVNARFRREARAQRLRLVVDEDRE